MSSVQHSRPVFNWRTLSIYGGGLTALIVLFFVSLCYGEASIPLHTVVDSLMGRQDTLEHNMIWDLRMPRTVIGILAGGALAVAGSLLQTITRNPLAASDTLGINAGAYFVVVLGTIFFPGLMQQSPFLFAVLGGLLAAAAAYFMGGGRTSSPVRLALSGMIVSMVLGSFTSALHIFFSQETQALFLWGSGTLVQNDWSGVIYAWPWVIGITIVALVLSRQWDMLELDESTASSLGQKVGMARATGLIIAVLLAAVIVSVIGPIGFVGLVAPHLVRLSGIRSNRLLLPGVFLWGAALLVGADVLAKMVHNSSLELPTGAVMAIIGAPWLIWLVLTRMKAANGSGMSTSMSTGARSRRWAFGPIAIIFTVLTLALVLLSTMFGGMRIPMADLLPSLFQSDGLYSAIVQLRIPRTLVAAGAGAALAVSGVLIQMAVRNPLADASIVGVSSGAGLGAMMVIILWPGLPVFLLPIAAIVGAGIAAAVVFSLSWKKGLNPSAVVLLGIAMSAIAGAGIQVLIVRGAVYGSSGFIWLTGSTYARTWDQVKIIGVFLLILIPLAWWLARRFELLVFDDNSASGLGLSVRRTRLLAMTVGVLLAAGAVACVGTVGFIGLIAPHMVRLLTGNKLRRSMFLSALVGAVMLVLADTIGRTVMAPTEIPSGLLIAIIGTPYFLYLMYRSNWRKSA
ncbi:iron complex transport system permease protein [Paenibacillus sp. ov031]|uniref:iron ABC transporter permease n=1 Tax=Paenibacillus TaxID=44249 RepID=UPI00091B3B20|nr:MULTISPECIES: iron ABC transporter permease [Paenibacillus]MCZ1268287.1 iron ABC transporter permease [Paenibacillus tundrae]SHN77086.1 iron complex transport system permease protein [Paenibacillus sp. ov031]